MFYLIGLGLSGEQDLTMKAVKALRKSKEVYLEYYTSMAPELKIKKLEEMIKKKVKKLKREDVETGDLILRSKRANIALIIIGDPLTATTHTELLLECRKNGIKYEVIHNASVQTAVGETGLQLYKFGRTISVPFHAAESYLQVIKQNQAMGAHTLCLLDLDVENKRFMTVNEALERLKLRDDEKIVVVSRLGCGEQKIKYVKPGDARELLLKSPCSIIIPGKLNFKEEEY